MNILPQKTTSKLILDALIGNVELFSDPSGVAWVGIPTQSGYPEYIPLRSSRFSTWVANGFFRAHNRAPGEKAITDARNVLAGIAGEVVKPIYIRVANLGDRVYVDLGSAYIEIRADGWWFTDKPPVPFRRPPGMLPLPRPNPAYESRLDDDIAELTGITGDNLTLITAWLLGAYNRLDYPILVINGEQGSGKSTISELLKRIVDPSEVLLRAMPRDEQALAVAAHNSWVTALDNLSHVPDWLSDALCRISTGAGYSARKLYFDLEEIFSKTNRPVILNSIVDLASRGDLMDRCIIVQVPAITEIQRRSKEEILAQLDQKLPFILAKLFDSISAAIGSDFIPSPLPRMADFSIWAARGIGAATWEGADAFLRAYAENRENATLTLIDTSPIAQEIQQFVTRHRQWNGSISDLKDKLTVAAVGTPTEKTLQQMTPRKFAGELRRLAPVLRKVGVGIDFIGLQRVNGVVARYVELADMNITQKTEVL